MIIKDIRDGYIAHYTETTALIIQREKRSPKVPISDLQTVKDATNELIQTLAFEKTYTFLPAEYAPDVRPLKNVDSRPDIERILDNIARNSELLNMPERQPNIWRHRYKFLTEEELEVINKYRLKFNLQPVNKDKI